MATQIGDLVVRVGADISTLKSGMKSASDSVDTFTSKAKKQLKELRDNEKAMVKVAAAAVAAGAAVIAGLVASGMKSIDTQSKLAQALDGTIGGLRAAEMAAGDAGVATEDFYQSATKMNQALGKAAEQSGPAYQALNKLGLSAEYLISLDIDQRFAAIADAMDRQNLSGAQAQVIMKDLGVRNENLANLMRQGGEAFREQANEVDRLGLRLSAVDAAKVEMANDAIGVFQDVLTGVQGKLSVAAAPYITVLSEKFREAAVESGGFKSQLESAISSTLRGFGFLADAVHGVHVVLKGMEVVARGALGVIATSIELAGTAITFLIDGVIKNVNHGIDAINRLTGSDIGKIDTLSDSAFMKGLHVLGDTARDQVGIARDELMALIMQEMPSEKVKRYLDEVSSASQKTAAEIVAARKTIAGGSEGGPVDTGDSKSQDQFNKDMQAWIKQQQMQLDAVKQRYVTEEQLLAEHRELMNVIGDEYDAAKFESEAQWRSIREQAEAEHLARMQDLNRSAYEGIANIIHKHWGNAAASTAGAIKSIMGTMATGSRKAFEISKAWAMADALISTFQGIAAGVRLGWPMGIPAVAWASATGFAQVSAIRAQSFGGAGGAAARGDGAPATAPNPIGVGGATGGRQQNQTLTVAPINPNAIFSGAAMQSFGQQIYDYSKDGGKVVFSA